MSYARLIVDIAHAQVDRLFTYRIPQGMELSVGAWALVPFGPRKIEGFVLEITDEPGDVQIDKIKDIIAPLDEEPVLKPPLIRLAGMMQSAYHCLMVDALRLMMPAQMRGGRIRAKMRLYVRLLVEGEALESAIAACHRAKRQQEALEELQSRGGEAPLNALGDLAPAAHALEKKGYVEILPARVLRRPAGEALGGGDHTLTARQSIAAKAIGDAVAQGGGTFLLHGVTGSGKTEVYIHAIRDVLAQGGGAIVLVPEIALTPQMVGWFRARFGEGAAVLHSRLSPGERLDEWQRIREGDARVVVGARSAVFAPLSDLKLIVLDEEHESSYQSEKSPQYDAREVARMRCEIEGAALVLGSATPSLRSYAMAMRGRMELLELPERVTGRPMPDVRVIDMRLELMDGNKSIFSGALMRGLRETFAAGEQAMLFINRRGHSTFVSCRACGEAIRCENCDITMTYHLGDTSLRCHYCDAMLPMPEACPACQSPYIRYFGSGTQKVEQEFKQFFPNIPCLRMDYDTTRGKDGHLEILRAFREGEAPLLIGTQMIAKGHDFPNVTLVGIVAADLSLNLPDYRSEERTFQLLTQMAGRAGRGNLPGQVIVQTYDPAHYAIELAARQDYRAFYHAEMNRRRKGLHPPYTTVGRLLITAEDEEAARETALRLGEALEEIIGQNPQYKKQTVQTRAMEAPLKRIRGEFRHQVFIKMFAKGDTESIWNQMRLLAEREKETGQRILLEIDPQNML